MNQKPNGALTFLFSLVPGAGHMYFGLMKRGASFMLAFFGSIFATAFVGRYFSILSVAFALLIPVTWFIAFFDFWRFPRMGEEERAAVTDEFLMVKQLHLPQDSVMRKVRIGAGILLILAGLQRLYAEFHWRVLYQYLHSERLITLLGNLPAMLGAVAIIVVGLLLILWKSKQIKKEANDDEE